jgi:hypothetical protein
MADRACGGQSQHEELRGHRLKCSGPSPDWSLCTPMQCLTEQLLQGQTLCGTADATEAGNRWFECARPDFGRNQ